MAQPENVVPAIIAVILALPGVIIKLAGTAAVSWVVLT